MLVIGLISGTSVDAIDAALVDITKDDTGLVLDLRGFMMQPFEPELQARIRALLPPHQGSTLDVCEVNALVGEAFAAAALRVAAQAEVDINDVALVASHGQTVYHQIAVGSVRSTLQIGSAAIIAERTGRTVISDFRARDMAVGGEGAPLVPYLDVLLYADNQGYQAFQNIGGIGNVALIQPDGATLAFDTGPGNVLIDEAVRRLTDDAQTYDRDGMMAARGTADETLLREWLAHPFFALRPPKSTGREAWGPREAASYIAQAEARGLGPDDTIATLTAFTARSIADAYHSFVGRVDQAIIAGGGARNPTLLAMLAAALPDTTVLTADAVGLSADAKEALAFAVMGYATLHGWPANVPAATGASAPAVLGTITPGQSYRAVILEALATPLTPPRKARLQLPPKEHTHA